MNPRVQSLFHDESATWSHIAWDPESLQAAIVDPVLDFDPASGRTTTESAHRLQDFVQAQSLSVRWILETHAHADHLSAAQWLRGKNPGSRIAIGDGIRTVQHTFGEIFNLGSEFARDGSQFDHLFQNGEVFELGGVRAEVIATPGHTNDSVAYLIGDALFTGDSIFMPDGGTARCDFPGGSAPTLFRSIQRLYSLPATTRVFVCHDYGPDGREVRCETTIDEQRRSNIHVRDGVSESEFVKMREARDVTLAMPRLLLPSVQVNIRAGELPPPEDNGTRYLKLPLDRL